MLAYVLSFYAQTSIFDKPALVIYNSRVKSVLLILMHTLKGNSASKIWSTLAISGDAGGPGVDYFFSTISGLNFNRYMISTGDYDRLTLAFYSTSRRVPQLAPQLFFPQVFFCIAILSIVWLHSFEALTIPWHHLSVIFCLDFHARRAIWCFTTLQVCRCSLNFALRTCVKQQFSRQKLRKRVKAYTLVLKTNFFPLAQAHKLLSYFDILKKN